MACGVCGETETKLVDGYYYCAECGTQDTNLQETIVEHQALADGTFGIASRSKYSVKIKEGVQMSPEWYKWHKYNFLLAGLTEHLIELGAAPSVRMKVLWIWTRYIKLFQKKDEMGPVQGLNQLRAGSSSEEEAVEEGAGEGEEDLAALARRGALKLDRVSGYVVVAILALALNFDRSPFQVSHVTRWARLRLLPVADVPRLVPADVLRHCSRRGRQPPTAYYAIPFVMARMSRLLALGAPATPDVASLLRSLLRELRLPAGLAPLVRALVRLLPVSFHVRHVRRPRRARQESRVESRFPDYEATLMAYIVVALKMCFGLDDDCEQRLSDAVERVNEEACLPRAYSSAPEPSARLFSFRAWAAHLRLRARLLARHHAPLGWLRGGGAGGEGGAAALAQLREFTGAAPEPAGTAPRKGAKARVTDRVTMEILRGMPRRFDPGVPSLEALRPAAAAPEPQAALARAVAPLLPPRRRALLEEDFTQYSLAYAARRLALPAAGAERLRGVRGGRGCARRKLGGDIYGSVADSTTVYVKNCPDKNWARAGRPTAAHVAPDSGSDSSPASRPGSRERRPATFAEEEPGRNIFDDDFSDVTIKEEKPDLYDDVPVDGPDAKDAPIRFDDFADFGPDGADRKSDDDVRDVFDSDDEARPRYDPGTFRRREVIKEIMTACYKKYHVRPPTRFQTEKNVNNQKVERPTVDRRTREYRLLVDSQVHATRMKLQRGREEVASVLAAYREHLQRDVLLHVQERVRAAAEAAEPALEPEVGGADEEPEPADDAPPEPEPEVGGADEDQGDVEIIENEKNEENDDDDSCDEDAYDPVLKSDAKFDEKTHDVDQLYLKMAEVPLPEPDESPDDDVLAIIDERIRRRKKQQVRKKERKVINTAVDHLVDDPERIDGFNYWFAKLDGSKTYGFIRQRHKIEKELKKWSPRSFWFVLTECAAAIDLWPSRLYLFVLAIEAEMLKLLPALRARRGAPRRTSYSQKAEPLKKNGQRARVNINENISAGTNSEEVSSSSEDQNHQTPKTKGRPRKNKDRDQCKASDSSDSMGWRPRSSDEDSDADTSFSEDSERPRKRVPSSKIVDGVRSKPKDSRKCPPNKPVKYSEDDTGRTEEEEQPRREEKSLENVNVCSDTSEVRERRASRYLEDESILHCQNQERKSKKNPLSDESDSQSDSSSTCSERDTILSGDREEPRKKGKPLQKKNVERLETNDSQKARREKPSKHLDRTSSSEGEHSSSSENQKQIQRPSRYLQNKESRRSRKREEDRRNYENDFTEASCDSQESTRGADFSDLSKRGHRRKRETRRKLESPYTSEDGSSSAASDSSQSPGRLQEDSSVSEDNEHLWTPGRPCRSMDDKYSKDTGVSQHLTENDLTPQNQEQPRKRGRPRKYLDSSSLQKGSTPQNQGQPRKRGRPRKYSKSCYIQKGGTQQNQELPRKRGRPRKDEDPKRKQGNPLKHVDTDLSEVNTSPSTPERLGTYSHSLEDDNSLENTGHTKFCTRISLDGTPSDTDDPRQIRSERSTKNLDEDASTSEPSENKEPSRKRGRPRKSLDQSLPVKANTTNISSTCPPITVLEDALQERPECLEKDSSTSPLQNRSKIRERHLKSVDDNLPKSERNFPKTRVSQETSSNKPSPYSGRKRQDLASTPQNREHQRKRKYPAEDPPRPSAFQKIPKTSTSRVQGGLPKRGRGRPSKFVDWTLLNASTPQAPGRGKLNQHVGRSFPGDLSAIQLTPASGAPADTKEEPLWSESKVIGFDQF